MNLWLPNWCMCLKKSIAFLDSVRLPTSNTFKSDHMDHKKNLSEVKTCWPWTLEDSSPCRADRSCSQCKKRDTESFFSTKLMPLLGKCNYLPGFCSASDIQWVQVWPYGPYMMSWNFSVLKNRGLVDHVPFGWRSLVRVPSLQTS